MRTEKIEIIIISLLITSLFVNPLMSQTATKLSILDTRNVNTGPNGFSSEIKAEFKQRSIIGVPGTGTYSGLLTIAPWHDNSGNKHHQLNFNDGGIFYRTGLPSETTWGTWSKLILENANGNVGIGTTSPTEKLTVTGGHNDTKIRLSSIGNGSDQPANLSLWASEPGWTYYGTGIGYNVNGSPHYGRIDNTRGSSYIRFLPGETKFMFQTASVTDVDALTVKDDGKVGIGTSVIPSEFKLAVAGKVIAEEVVVKLQSAWPDYVFHQDYRLKPLHEVEQFVKTNKHLPGIPSAAQVEEKGLSMGEMQNKLLQKVEELTLYIIEQQKQIDQQNEKIRLLENR